MFFNFLLKQVMFWQSQILAEISFPVFVSCV